MGQVTLPHRPAGTDTRSIAQILADFDAILDQVNGNLEGGGGVNNNFKAGGITSRELDDNILVTGLKGYGDREGLVTQPSGVTEALKVTPGSGLTLNYSAGVVLIRDDSGVVATGALIPVTVGASSVVVGANASGNPRLDQVILTMTGYGTGTVSVLAGTPNAATTLNNRTGAASLPNDAIRLADVLITNGFAGPFVNHTSLRNRIPWAVPMLFKTSAGSSFDFVFDSYAEEEVYIDWHMKLSALANISMQMEGITAAQYSNIYQEATITTASASSTAMRGAHGGTTNFLLLPSTATASGSVHGSGRVAWHAKPIADTLAASDVEFGELYYTVLSDTGGGANVRITNATGSIMLGFTTGLKPSWANIFPSSGNFTGHMIVDRIPTLAA